MANLSKNTIEKIQEIECRLTELGFNSVWQKVVNRIPFDVLYSYWINLQSGQTVLLVTSPVHHQNHGSISIFECKEINLQDLMPKQLKSSGEDETLNARVENVV